jgi:RNA polymerase sigma-70 factor (ECF subfamily)
MMVKNSEDSQDLAQETFEKAWKQLPELQNSTKFKSWLYGIATHRVLDHLRKRKRSAANDVNLGELEENLLFESSNRFEEGVEQRELLVQALLTMPEKLRLCLLMDLKGLSHEEIAKLIGCSPHSFYTYLSRARKVVRANYRALALEQM